MEYAGGLPLPTVKVTLADGTVLRGHEACEALRSDPKSPEEVFTPELSGLVMPPAQWAALARPTGVPGHDALAIDVAASAHVPSAWSQMWPAA